MLSREHSEHRKSRAVLRPASTAGGGRSMMGLERQRGQAWTAKNAQHTKGDAYYASLRLLIRAIPSEFRLPRYSHPRVASRSFLASTPPWADIGTSLRDCPANRPTTLKLQVCGPITNRRDSPRPQACREPRGPTRRCTGKRGSRGTRAPAASPASARKPISCVKRTLPNSCARSNSSSFGSSPAESSSAVNTPTPAWRHRSSSLSASNPEMTSNSSASMPL